MTSGPDRKGGRTRSNHATEGFDDFWDLYHRITQKNKINIARARKEWKKLTATEKKLALENIEEYYAHQKIYASANRRPRIWRIKRS